MSRSTWARCLIIAGALWVHGVLFAGDADREPKEIRAISDNHKEVTELLTTMLGEIGGLSFEPIVLDGSDGRDAGVIGLTFDFSKSLKDSPLGNGTNAAILSFEIHGEGTITREREDNPNDRISAGFRLVVWQHLLSNAPVEELAQLSRGYKNNIAKKRAEIEDKEELRRFEESEVSALYRNYQTAIRNDFHSLRWQLSLDASIEASQDFSDRQLAYSATVGTVGSVGDRLSWINVVDYPAALVRWLLGRDPTFQVRGNAVPSIIAGIALVDPQNNQARLAIDDDNQNYPRFQLEVGYRTDIARAADKDIELAMGFRLFQELGASSQVRQADADRDIFFSARLGFRDGLGVTYSSGRLPVDVKNDDVIAIGWAFAF